ncbi:MULTISPECIES: amylo-alpha-1,6-glucosidase [unclassified Fusibacter]|uniref:amylo-alpha-1,6-glucosidase n=1 Tax=unclassified Fusibacter TaxID=2624464 RepID=UPI0013E96132|nr:MULTISPECIES: amylo-alpha-1,6-glucosidase [unclassified Fusibacter]MCK8059050.1 amylo-alpha-1,6-glucosidase [Fusibacter sp. A2]NPE22461.1 glycogen debranching protein [Fusibacter sp. A1]
MIKFDQSKANEQEVLITNGLGGYSLLSTSGINFRKYHSLYTVSLKAPVARTHILSKLLMTLSIGGKSHQLNADLKEASDSKYSYATSVTNTGAVIEKYEVEGVCVTRRRAFDYLTSRMGICYEIVSDVDAKLTISPLFNIRDHHDAVPVTMEDYSYDYVLESKALICKTALSGAVLVSELEFTPNVRLSETSYYKTETRRGYPDLENHYCPGDYSYAISKGTQEFSMTIDLEMHEVGHAKEIIAKEEKRITDFERNVNLKDKRFEPLVLASDQFIVERSTTGTKTVIAGYPWFTDWGRDTMIALPGLTLETGRYAEALELIETFIAYQKQGVIPNNFPDDDEEPMYNTADATLWLYQAIFAYYQKTKDDASIKRLFPKLEEMFSYLLAGTINDIYVDEDGLMSTGNEKTQLTWMDVKVNGWVVTPRHGKAVEINALFYNALCVMDAFSKIVDADRDYAKLASKVKLKFNELFWNEKENRLYDLIIDGVRHDIIRPNMLFAISLPFTALNRDKWEAVVNTAQDHLLFDYGLRSVSPEDKDYHGKYEGDLLSRDGAYHRGAGWGWLIGPYLEAHYKTFNDKDYIKERLDLLLPHLNQAAIGSISENFEGDAPNAPRGCCAQAWSVAEVLRIVRMME